MRPHASLPRRGEPGSSKRTRSGLSYEAASTIRQRSATTARDVNAVVAYLLAHRYAPNRLGVLRYSAYPERSVTEVRIAVDLPQAPRARGLGMSTLELDDIQADVAVPYPGWGITYRFYKLQRHGRMIADPGSAASVLNLLANSVTKSGQVRPETTWTLTVGFTAPGLEAIGVSTDTMTTLPDAFVDGMYRRADKLGDDIAQWDDDFKNNHIDMVAVLRYASDDARKAAEAALSTALFDDTFATAKFHSTRSSSTCTACRHGMPTPADTSTSDSATGSRIPWSRAPRSR